MRIALPIERCGLKKPKNPADISQEDWDDVDSPPLTAEQLKSMRPLAEVVDTAKESVEEGVLKIERMIRMRCES
jgi:hypothetical protein